MDWRSGKKTNGAGNVSERWYRCETWTFGNEWIGFCNFIELIADSGDLMPATPTPKGRIGGK
jgi:hypothetical protein